MKTKILFTDLDGTLLNTQKEVSKRNREAMEQMKQEGHRLVLTTGRSVSSAKMIAEKLGLLTRGNYIISYNGGTIFEAESNQIILQRSVPLPSVFSLFQAAREAGMYIQTYQEEKVLSERNSPYLEKYLQFTKMKSQICERIEQILTTPPPKMIVIDEDLDRLRAFGEKMKERYVKELDLVYSEPEYQEYCPIGVSKGNAVKLMCDYLQIPIEQSVAVGDGYNDISMLKEAGVGVAMCNASSQEVLQSADVITEQNNDEDGFAWVVEKFVL